MSPIIDQRINQQILKFYAQLKFRQRQAMY
jgi:hypothetical protein